MALERETISLTELNRMIQFAIHLQLPDKYWITAELNEVRVGSGGHCYLEFVEKNDRGNVPLAKARGIIWSNNYRILSHKFEEQAGVSISAGLKVLVNVSVEFHELYGYSLNVVDIDPSYTLGDLYMKRKEIILRLEDEGVIGMNRELDFPVVPQRVAIISSPSAAGYGDFLAQLDNNPYGIRFYTELFPAVMQGEQVEKSIIAALDSIYERHGSYDVVVIIRGGGASSDLSGFDSYNLAFHCTQFPLPIISGIGHERDKTVLDYVANVSVKTPTAAAQYLITAANDFAVTVSSLASGIQKSVERCISDEKLWQSGLVSALNMVVSRNLHSHKAMINELSVGVRSLLYTRLGQERAVITLQESKIPLVARNKLELHKRMVEKEYENIRFILKGIFREERHMLELFGKTVYNTDPKRILERGFVVMRHDGKAVRSRKDILSGEKYDIETADGKIEVKIK